MKCSVSLNIMMFKLPRTGGISPSLRKQSICRKPGPTNGESKVLAVADDRIEGGDILDAIIAKGCCVACLTPWTKVFKTEGKHRIRVEGGCPNEVCVLEDW